MLSLQCSSSVRIQKKPHPELNALLISFHFICIRSLQTKSFGALCVNEETELRKAKQATFWEGGTWIQTRELWPQGPRDPGIDWLLLVL